MVTVASIRARCSEKAEKNELVNKAVCTLLDQTIPSKLIKKKTINMNVLRLEAFSINVLTQIPKVPITLIKVDKKWEPLMISKELTDHWDSTMGKVLKDTFYEKQGREVGDYNAKEIAQDICKLLVDPDGRYGIVLVRVKDIPVGYQRSDVYRDLVRAGMSRSEIESKLLRNVTIPIAPPKLMEEDCGLCLRFFTWHYFGGELCQWTILIGKKYTIKREIISVEVGSYDYFM